MLGAINNHALLILVLYFVQRKKVADHLLQHAHRCPRKSQSTPRLGGFWRTPLISPRLQPDNPIQHGCHYSIRSLVGIVGIRFEINNASDEEYADAEYQMGEQPKFGRSARATLPFGSDRQLLTCEDRVENRIAWKAKAPLHMR